MSTVPSVEARTESGAGFADLLRLHDAVGVLSVYAGIDPAGEARARPAWRIQLAKELRTLRGRLRTEGDRTRRAAFDHCLHALAPALSNLVDATESGRGHALFAGVASGDVHTFSVQFDLPTEAMLGEIAHVVPLLRLDDGHPRALVLIGRDQVRVVETRLGRAAELQTFDVEPVVYDGPERKGPAAAPWARERAAARTLRTSSGSLASSSAHSGRRVDRAPRRQPRLGARGRRR